MPINAKIFTNGRNQAVRIPREFDFKGVDAVTIEKQGNTLLLKPARSTWSSFKDENRADDDFMHIRPRLIKSS